MLILTYCSTEYTLNIILRGASASKKAPLVVKLFEIVFRVGRYPPFVPRLIKVSLNSRQNCTEMQYFPWSWEMKTKRTFRLEKLKFLICTLRKSHFCGAPARRMKYSRVNLNITIHCNTLVVLPSADLHLNFFEVVEWYSVHTRQWKLSPPSPVWDYQEFDPGLKFWSLCNISRVIMQKWNIRSHHHHFGIFEIFEIFEIFARPPDHLGIEEQAGYWQSCRQWRSPQKRSRSLTHNERPCWWGRTYSSSEVFFYVSSNKYLADLLIRTTFI